MLGDLSLVTYVKTFRPQREKVAGTKWGLKPLLYTFVRGSLTTSASTCVLALVVKEHQTSPSVMGLALAPSVPEWWAIVVVAPLVMEYQWQLDLLCPGGAFKGGFYTVYEWLVCRQWKHW
jgi:hypothetical protein